MHCLSYVALGVVAFSAAPAAAAPAPAKPAPAAAYERLRALVGTWTAPLATPGKQLQVSFKLISNDSTLLETYVTPSGRETITVFHMDGPRLLATHYCAQGNQPRLALIRATDAPAQWIFDFVDATNLATPQSSHLHHLEVAVTDADHFTMVETYRENGKDDPETHQFSRVKPAKP